MVENVGDVVFCLGVKGVASGFNLEFWRAWRILWILLIMEAEVSCK